MCYHLPRLKSVCQLVAEDKLTDVAYQSPAVPIAPIDILYGHRGYMANGNLYMSHRCGFTEKVLRATLTANGFISVGTMSRPRAFDLWAIASKNSMSEDEIRRICVEHFPL